jgi:RES domain-containing protein
VAYGRGIRRGGGGQYNRLVLPGWTDPLDSAFSEARGGRWNSPGAFPVLYLNRGERMARIQVLDKLAGQPYGPEDLDPGQQHQLVHVDVPKNDYLDAVTDIGLRAVGLPDSYPKDASGVEVEWPPCQAVGQAAWDDGSPGIACRSAANAASPADEELALFDRAAGPRAVARDRLAFSDWFVSGTPSSR